MMVSSDPADFIEREHRWGADNYHPLDVIVDRAHGVWVYDIAGKRYLDCLAAYSAVNAGHCHPEILRTFAAQAAKVTLTSRAFRNEELPFFCEELAALCEMDAVLPMNTGAEAIETAIKAARRYGYEHKGIPDGAAEIIVCANNFHGRTTTIVGFSSEPAYRDGFGPFAPGFRKIPFGDAAALEAAITPNTCAFLVEPIQCEAGVIVPPEGYLRACAEICARHGVLFIADEVQTGLGRTGELFACRHEEVQPDVFVLGKALSGGFYPVSAMVTRREIMDVFAPGSHGSTFGGNPLACAVARAAMRVVRSENLAQRSRELGAWFIEELRTLRHPHIVEVRGRGLLIGIELATAARPYCERLAELGVLTKETHDTVIRLTPPLVVERAELQFALDALRKVLA